MLQGINRHIAQQVTEILHETLSFLPVRQLDFRYGFLFRQLRDKQIRHVHTERFCDQFQSLLGIFSFAVFQLIDIALRKATLEGEPFLGQSPSLLDSS